MASAQGAAAETQIMTVRIIAVSFLTIVLASRIIFTFVIGTITHFGKIINLFYFILKKMDFYIVFFACGVYYNTVKSLPGGHIMDNNTLVEFFRSVDEPYAAGLFEEPDKGYFYRHCRAYACWFNAAEPPEYKSGEKLYPCNRRYFEKNRDRRCVAPSYACTYDFDRNKFEKICAEKNAPEAFEALKSFWQISRNPNGWTHGSPNYSRIVREGLDSYRERILKISPDSTEKAEFRGGMLLLVDALKGYTERCVEYLVSVGADKELIEALRRVPFKPARTYYEGLVSWNMIFYFDGCDNLGCLDAGLSHLCRGEDMTDVIAELFDNIDAVDMWSCAIGPVYSDVTRQALRAIRGKRRPLLELRVTEDTPEDIWQLASEALATGCTNPSFYNEKGIHDMLHTRFPQIPDEDLVRFCGGGCTETNLEGLIHAGGTDRDVNLLKAFEEYLHSSLGSKATFEEFFEGACLHEEKFTKKIIEETQDIYRYRAEFLPHPMRTLLFDDCIDNAKDYNNGGTRYTWTMNSESGLINIIDCLAAIKELYYDKKLFSAEKFLELLKNEDDELFSLLAECPCFGTDNEAVDAMGAEFARRIFSVYRNKKPDLDFLDGFTLTEHQFTRYEGAGECVGATPDGRRAGQPTCDSLAALRGKAVKGPTAMLCSSSKLPQELVDGISVVNLTLMKNVCRNPVILKGIIMGYFNMGGIQLQITSTSPEELKDALVHPENHRDLIVRVGGYSEYFRRLSPALRKAVVERNVHEMG